jgi:dimethylhistidine N-methyltransferase
VAAGLSARPKRIASKWLYDGIGASLFEAICNTGDYYIARVETALLRTHAPEIADIAGPQCLLVELGSGACAKVRALLDALAAPAGYVPIDVAAEQLAAATQRLRRDFPGLRVLPICGDYTGELALPAPAGMRRRLGFFPGSTVCNMLPQEMGGFLRRLGPLLGARGLLLLGVDLPKDPERLRRAYNGCGGLMAAFNLNLLTRINRELDGNFDATAFRHEAAWVPAEERIEIHLVARRTCAFQAAGRCFRFVEGERIHMENSHKFGVARFQSIAQSAGWHALRAWVDEGQLFSIHLLARVIEPVQ